MEEIFLELIEKTWYFWWMNSAQLSIIFSKKKKKKPSNMRKMPHFSNKSINKITYAQSLSRVWLFCHPMDYSAPGSSAHGIFPTRILKWVAIPSSKGSSQPRNQTYISCVSCIAGRLFTTELQVWINCILFNPQFLLYT